MVGKHCITDYSHRYGQNLVLACLSKIEKRLRLEEFKLFILWTYLLSDIHNFMICILYLCIIYFYQNAHNVEPNHVRMCIVHANQ